MVVFNRVAPEVTHRMALSFRDGHSLDKPIDSLQVDNVLEIHLSGQFLSGNLKLLVLLLLARYPTAGIPLESPTTATAA